MKRGKKKKKQNNQKIKGNKCDENWLYKWGRQNIIYLRKRRKPKIRVYYFCPIWMEEIEFSRGRRIEIIFLID